MGQKQVVKETIKKNENKMKKKVNRRKLMLKCGKKNGNSKT